LDQSVVVLPAPTDAETAVPEATATVALTATPEPLPSATLAATDTPPPEILLARGCIRPDVFAFLWQDAQLASCSDNAVAETIIDAGQEVVILDTTSRSASEPGNCSVNSDFLNVQSAADSTLQGWVLESNIQLLSPGESCSP
jgi:hypothetical protein